jgi:hypothetical protein
LEEKERVRWEGNGDEARDGVIWEGRERRSEWVWVRRGRATSPLRTKFPTMGLQGPPTVSTEQVPTLVNPTLAVRRAFIPYHSDNKIAV